MADDDLLPTDARDEALAGALDVEPLDELTRRRLVSAALAATDARSGEAAAPAAATARARALGIAAAAVAFVVLGVAALTLPGDSGDLASRAPQPQRSRLEQAPSTAVEQAPEAANAPSVTDRSSAGAALATDAATAFAENGGGVPDLGQLGDLGVAGSHARVVAAAQPAVDGIDPQEWSLLFQSCPPRTLTIVATGLGTIDGEPVQVVVSRRDDGSLHVRAIDGTTCKVRALP